MFYTEILPSALPVMMHPYGRTASPHGGCPMRMGAWGPEMRPRRCGRRQPTCDDFLSRLFELNSDCEEEDSSDTPTIDVLLKELFEDRTTKEKCSKSKCDRKQEECPMRMGAWGPEMRPRRQPTFDDFLSGLFEFNSDSDEEDSSDTSPIDALLKALFEDRATKEKCDKSKCERGAKEKTGIKKGTKCETKSKGEVKPKCDHSDTKSDKPNGGSILATLNMRGCDPNSIEVKILHEKKIVKITAKHTVGTPFGPMMRQGHQTVPIPEGVSPKQIRSFISPDGLLYLKASTPTETLETKENEDKAASEKMDVEMKAANTAETVKHYTADQTSTENGDGESTASEDTQLTTIDSNTACDITPKENLPTETVLQAESSPETADVTTDNEESKNRKQTSESTAFMTEHGFVVVEAKSEDKSGVTNAANDDSTDDITNTDEENSSTVAQFDMAGFSADDIKVNINEEAGIMEVSAKREENTESGRFLREYYRTFPVTQDLSGNRFETNLSSEGVFSIQAPNSGKALKQ